MEKGSCVEDYRSASVGREKGSRMEDNQETILEGGGITRMEGRQSG